MAECQWSRLTQVTDSCELRDSLAVKGRVTIQFTGSVNFWEASLQSTLQIVHENIMEYNIVTFVNYLKGKGKEVLKSG